MSTANAANDFRRLAENPTCGVIHMPSHCGVQKYASFRGISNALHPGLSVSRLRAWLSKTC
jgi:hypothetical protein